MAGLTTTELDSSNRLLNREVCAGATLEEYRAEVEEAEGETSCRSLTNGETWS